MGRVQRRVTAGCAGRHSRRRGEGVAGVCGRGQHSAEAHVTRDARARVCLIRVRAGSSGRKATARAAQVCVCLRRCAAQGAPRNWAGQTGCEETGLGDHAKETTAKERAAAVLPPRIRSPLRAQRLGQEPLCGTQHGANCGV